MKQLLYVAILIRVGKYTFSHIFRSVKYKMCRK